MFNLESGKMIGWIIGIVISLIVVATVLPTGIQALVNSTGTWGDTTVETLAITILPLVVVVAVIMVFVEMRKEG